MRVAFPYTDGCGASRYPDGSLQYTDWESMFVSDVAAKVRESIEKKQEYLTSIYLFRNELDSKKHTGYFIGNLTVELDGLTLEDARLDAVKIIEYMQHMFGVSPDSWQIAYSGNRGFKLALPFEHFLLNPKLHYHEVLKLFVINFLKPIASSVDTSIYGIRRQMRVDNTLHTKHMRYRIHLTYDELRKLSCDDIIGMSSSPRVIELPMVKSPNKKLVKVFDKLGAIVLESLEKERQTKFTTAKEAHSEEIVSLDTLVYGKFSHLKNGVPEGGRDGGLLILMWIGRQRGVSKSDMLRIAGDFNRRCSPPEKDKIVEKKIARLYHG